MERGFDPIGAIAGTTPKWTENVIRIENAQFDSQYYFVEWGKLE